MLILTGCVEFESNIYKNIFDDTPLESLSKAIAKEDIKEIKIILKSNPNLIDIQDPRYGYTLLHWSVGNGKYESTNVLLELGADPNIQSMLGGETPLFIASGYLWDDKKFDQDPKFVKLLLENGADPNIAINGSQNGDSLSDFEVGYTPLMHSVGRGIEKTRLLLEFGAVLNQETNYGRTVVTYSLVSERYIDYAYLLIVENKASVTEPYYSELNKAQMLYSVNKLRYLIFDLDSEEYIKKKQIIEEYMNQGEDYYNTDVPERALKQIKHIYPDDWIEYLKIY